LVSVAGRWIFYKGTISTTSELVKARLEVTGGSLGAAASWRESQRSASVSGEVRVPVPGCPAARHAA
jgi:hypothetical protein